MLHHHPDDADNEVYNLPSEDDRRNIPDSLGEQRPNRKLQKHGAPCNRPTALPSSGSESESNDSNYHSFSPIKNANACVSLTTTIFCCNLEYMDRSPLMLSEDPSAASVTKSTSSVFRRRVHLTRDSQGPSSQMWTSLMAPFRSSRLA